MPSHCAGRAVLAVDNPPATHGPERSEGHVVHVTEAVFRDLSQRVEACFDAVSLADICAQAERMGLRRGSSESYSYVI